MSTIYVNFPDADFPVENTVGPNHPLPMTASATFPVNCKIGAGDLTVDAWGVQKVSLPYSVFHGLFTFDVPRLDWFMYENGTEVATSATITSTGGAMVMTTSAAKTALILEARRCVPYQPNRGVLYSTALWCPSKTANGEREWGLQTAEAGVFFRLKADGLLYAVQRSLGSETKEEVITTSSVSGFDVQKGNIYDIQYQWRGVGNYKFFINNVLVKTFANLGTLTALSMSNPTLPAVFKATRITADVAIHAGCVDISSENGKVLREEAFAAYAQGVATNGADKPILVVHNPLLIGSATNTRTIHLHNLSVSNTKKCFIKLWKTRTVGNITGATLVRGYGGVYSYVQTDSTNMNAGAVRATAVTAANLQFLTAMNLEAGVANSIDLSHNGGHASWDLVRGDYLVITNDSTNGTSDVVINWGEEV